MMRRPTIDPKLEALPAFAGCSRKEKAEASRLVTLLDVKDGTVLTREGRAAREVILVLEGSVAVSQDGKVISRLHRGDLIGENALLRDGRRTATVTADGPSVIGVCHPREFEALLQAVPGFERSLALAINRRLHAEPVTPSPAADARPEAGARLAGVPSGWLPAWA